MHIATMTIRPGTRRHTLRVAGKDVDFREQHKLRSTVVMMREAGAIRRVRTRYVKED
jgi:hypothetical protein